MKRFYGDVSVVTENGLYSVTLDDKPIRSPGSGLLALPTRALAESVAVEWRAQDEKIVPESMPMTRFVNSAIDRVRPRHEEVVNEIAAYADTDLLCYRSDKPEELADRQAFAWQPLLDWAAERYGAELRVTRTIVAVAQDDKALKALRAEVASHDDFVLSGLHSLTTATGSVVVALAVAEGRIAAKEAAAVSLIDETFQAEKWGEDIEAVARRESIGAEIAAAARFLSVALSESA